MSRRAIEAVRAALAADPSNIELRMALAGMLAADGRHEEAVGEAALVLTQRPGHPEALRVLTASGLALAGRSAPADADAEEPAGDLGAGNSGEDLDGDRGGDRGGEDVADFDWEDAEASLGETIPPPFVDDPGPGATGARDPREGSPRPGEGARDGAPADRVGGAERPRVTFADVGGLEDVKRRLQESFIQPMRHADIARAFGSTARGGLLLYGPPGCGKTFMGRAVAGELGAAFLPLVMTEVMDSMYGETEHNIHDFFEMARERGGATVVFLDEVDAVAQKRSALTNGAAWLRSTVNQLLLELDSMQGDNDGLYVLAATNHPWDIDEAFLRPGRLDRTILVGPPDPGAREAILRRELGSRPVAGVDLAELVAATDGFSGADIAHLCSSAAESALAESIASQEVRPVTMTHLRGALTEITPSTSEWIASARTVVRFSRDGGRYDDLRRYLDTHRGPEARGPRRGWWS